MAHTSLRRTEVGIAMAFEQVKAGIATLIKADAALPVLLERVCEAVDAMNPGCATGIVLADTTGTRISRIVGPALPARYRGHLEKQRLDYRAHNASPLLSLAGETLGLVAIYPVRHANTYPAEEHFVQQLAQLLAALIERDRGRESARLAEKTLSKLRSELTHVARVASLGALTASIVHEVNQPLCSCITNASTCRRMLEDMPLDLEGARATTRRAIRDGQRAAEVITRLRALFGKKGAPAESVNLNEAAREVLALASGELRHHRVVVRTQLAKNLPAVTGDRVQLQQVILNLILNARDAMSGIHHRPRRLLIRTQVDAADGVRVLVKDAGIGLKPDDLEKFFAAFYTTKDDGMGVGLSVSRSIIESHRGRLWGRPNEGAGATFCFSIPVSPRAESNHPARETCRANPAEVLRVAQTHSVRA